MAIDTSGPGYLAGEAPGGQTTVNQVPVSAVVKAFYELPETGDWQLAATTTSSAGGTWAILNVNPEFLFHVVGRLDGYNDVIVSNVRPTRTDVVEFSGGFTETERFNGLAGEVLITSGMPPFTLEVLKEFPIGLSPSMLGRVVEISGRSGDAGIWESSFRITDANSNYADFDISFEIKPESIDYFDEDSLSKYQIVMDSGSPNVSISGGFLSFSEPLNASQVAILRNGSLLGDMIVAGVITEAHDAGIVFRFSDVGNYYVATIHDNNDAVSGSRNTAALWRRSSGNWTQLGPRVPIPQFIRGTPHDFKVSAIGQNLKVFLDGVNIISEVDSTHASGLHGPRAQNAPVKFDSYSWDAV